MMHPNDEPNFKKHSFPVKRQRQQREAARREALVERQRRKVAERKAQDQEAKIRELEKKLKAQAASTPAALPAVAKVPAATKDETVSKSVLTAGTIFRDQLKGGGDGPQLVAIPAGRYWRGAADGEVGASSDEGPQKEVRIDYAFALGQYEVTVGEYLACVGDGGCKEPEWRERGSSFHYQTGSSNNYKKLGATLTEVRQPIVGVSWHDAKAYVNWLSGKSGQKYRLPSELEWEYAARGEAQGTKASLPYPWGTTASHEQANYGSDNCCSGATEGRDHWVYPLSGGEFPGERIQASRHERECI